MIKKNKLIQYYGEKKTDGYVNNLYTVYPFEPANVETWRYDVDESGWHRFQSESSNYSIGEIHYLCNAIPYPVFECAGRKYNDAKEGKERWSTYAFGIFVPTTQQVLKFNPEEGRGNLTQILTWDATSVLELVSSALLQPVGKADNPFDAYITLLKIFENENRK